jgi:hypothetical protein
LINGSNAFVKLFCGDDQWGREADCPAPGDGEQNPYLTQSSEHV